LYAWVKTRSRALPTLGWMKKRWDERSKDLPRVAYLRRYARFDISFVSSLGSEEDFERKRTTSESLKLFRALSHEIAFALQLAKQRLKKTDDFDWDAFAAQMSRQLDKLPTTRREFAELLKRLKASTEPG